MDTIEYFIELFSTNINDDTNKELLIKISEVIAETYGYKIEIKSNCIELTVACNEENPPNKYIAKIVGDILIDHKYCAKVWCHYSWPWRKYFSTYVGCTKEYTVNFLKELDVIIARSKDFQGNDNVIQLLDDINLYAKTRVEEFNTQE